jgi:hypothetical protein
MTNSPERDAVELVLERGTLREYHGITADKDKEGVRVPTDEVHEAYFAAVDELTRNNGNPIDWKYWRDLPKWTGDEAACLLFGVDPDLWVRIN